MKNVIEECWNIVGFHVCRNYNIKVWDPRPCTYAVGDPTIAYSQHFNLKPAVNVE